MQTAGRTLSARKTGDAESEAHKDCRLWRWRILIFDRQQRRRFHVVGAMRLKALECSADCWRDHSPLEFCERRMMCDAAAWSNSCGRLASIGHRSRPRPRIAFENLPKQRVVTRLEDCAGPTLDTRGKAGTAGSEVPSARQQRELASGVMLTGLQEKVILMPLKGGHCAGSASA